VLERALASANRMRAHQASVSHRRMSKPREHPFRPHTSTRLVFLSHTTLFRRVADGIRLRRYKAMSALEGGSSLSNNAFSTIWHTHEALMERWLWRVSRF
jgi:hypothetical protein